MPVPDPHICPYVFVFPKLPLRFWYVRQQACGGWSGLVFGDDVSEPTRTPIGERAIVIAAVSRPEVRRGLPIVVNNEPNPYHMDGTLRVGQSPQYGVIVG